MRRCLRMGGRLAIADLVCDPDAEVAEFQNHLERLRDPSHTRMLSLERLAELAGSTDVEFRDVERTLGPWLEQTQTPPEARAEIREALEAELAGGPATGFRPREIDGQLRFLHTAASIIA